jgi:hypothetical protein
MMLPPGHYIEKNSSANKKWETEIPEMMAVKKLSYSIFLSTLSSSESLFFSIFPKIRKDLNV